MVLPILDVRILVSRVRMCALVLVCARVRVCVRACVRACVGVGARLTSCECVRARLARMRKSGRLSLIVRTKCRLLTQKGTLKVGDVRG